ncbi:MAG: hypothetical protein IJM59_04725 [Proteobacteria bacterium]|nr:hypothetical protein [Pseudomonadota bacterium]
MIHRLSKTSLFILTMFLQSVFTFTGCTSVEEDEYVFENDPVTAYYGIVKTGGGCYEATEIYLLYEDIDCAKLNTTIPNYYGSIILSNFNKPGIYNISSSLAIDPKNHEKLIANVSFHGNVTYSSKSGTVEVKSTNENNNELQVVLDIELMPIMTSDNYSTYNYNPYHYKNTINVKYCQKINTATPDIKMEKCPNKE